MDLWAENKPVMHAITQQIGWLEAMNKKLANMINETFSRQCWITRASSHPPMHCSCLHDKLQVSMGEVEKKLVAIDIKAAGPDGMPNYVLRDFDSFLSSPITVIFSLLLSWFSCTMRFSCTMYHGHCQIYFLFSSVT